MFLLPYKCIVNLSGTFVIHLRITVVEWQHSCTHTTKQNKSNTLTKLMIGNEPRFNQLYICNIIVVKILQVKTTEKESIVPQYNLLYINKL